MEGSRTDGDCRPSRRVSSFRRAEFISGGGFQSWIRAEFMADKRNSTSGDMIAGAVGEFPTAAISRQVRTGSFDFVTASRSRSSYCAQDDRVLVDYADFCGARH